MTYLQILNTIKDTALAQPNVNSVVREFLDLNREDAKYSAVVIQDRDGSRDRIEEQDYITYTWHLGYVDRLTYDESNRDDIISTGINIINNIVNTIRNTWFPELEVSLSDRINTFDQRFTAQCAGVYGVLSVNALVSDCIDGESGDIYDKFKVEITENGDYHFVPSGKPVDEIDIIVNVENRKPEQSLVETITSNGGYHYAPEEGSVFSDANITVDVHPSVSLSETYTTNGEKTITGEFNGGVVTVDVHPTDTLSMTYVSNGSYNITGEWKDASIKVEVPSDKKPEKSLIETITTNGSYSYDPEGGSVFSGANITVDVHPSKSLSETYVSNGSYDISGEFNGGVITVNVPQSVTGYTQKEITEGNVSFINIDNSASIVASGAFIYNGTIQTVNLPYATTVGNNAFCDCDSLTQVSLPMCSYIGGFAFRFCSSLSQVSIPMCSSINLYAFGHCSSLKQVDLPMCSFIGNGAFGNCISLSQVSLPVCEYINNGAFENCSSLSQVSLPVCSYIGINAFYSCISLSQVSLPVCSYIGGGAFIFCSSLSQVSLPVCSYIGGFAFRSCSSLSKITIGYSSVCSLDSSDAFMDTPIEVAAGSIYVPGISGSIYVPASLVDAYKSADNWSYYSMVIYPIP